jgi:hypothetical protein
MALGTYANILTAIREVLDSNGGSIRQIASTRFTDDLAEGVQEPEAQRRGIRADKPFRVRITNQRRHEASPPINGSKILYRFDCEVTISRTVGVLEQVSADDFAALEALGWEDADAIRQALCTPPNLEQTAASAATNIIGDALTYVDSRGRLVPIKGDGAQRYETIHRFTAGLKVSPATV